MSAVANEATALLETAERHLRTVTAVIDRLAVLNAQRELHLVALRLTELAFRAFPEAERRPR